MADDNTTELTNELYRSFVVLFNNNALVSEVWGNRSGKPLENVLDKLVPFHMNQLMAADAEAYETYTQDILDGIKNLIILMLLSGFLVYYLDEKEIHGKSIKRVDDPSVEKHLMGVVKTLEDDVTEHNDRTAKAASKYDPPQYVFNACKDIFYYHLKLLQDNYTDENHPVKRLTSYTHRQFFLVKGIHLINEGYQLTAAQYQNGSNA